MTLRSEPLAILFLLAGSTAGLAAGPSPSPSPAQSRGETPATSTAGALRQIAALPGEPRAVSAAGLTGAGDPILTVENPSAFDPAPSSRRLVIVGGLDADDRSVGTTLALVRWFKTSAPALVRRQWAVSALPSAAFAATDGASLERWIVFQAPDVLVEVRADGKTLGLASVTSAVIRPGEPKAATAAIQKILADAPAARSAVRRALDERVSRRPLDVAMLLAKRYPESPSLSYISAVAWTSALRLSRLVGDESLASRVRQQTAPWVNGARPLFASGPEDRIPLTSIAGTMVFADLGGESRRLALEGARLAAARGDQGIAAHGQGWTDDMFMASAILSRVGELDGAARLLLDYAARLQRPDGIFIHATDGPFAWGRGNGFAALGLSELLTVLPDGTRGGEPDEKAGLALQTRSALLTAYRRQMEGVRRHQAPDGMWRQVIDEPGSYREETATAMLTTAMARGIGRGWLDRSYERAVDRGWRALLAHVRADGTLIDVCTGTGAGPSKRYYLDRTAITGADDRGGAMALLAAMEVAALGTP